MDKWIYFRADKIVYCRLPTFQVDISRVFIYFVKYTKLIFYTGNFIEWSVVGSPQFDSLGPE